MIDEWITVTKGREVQRVRPRGLQALLDKGWEESGANRETLAPQESGESSIVDSGEVIAYPTKRKAK